MRDEWELYAEGVAAAEAILKATFGIEVRKSLNPLNLHDFQVIVRTLATSLKGQVVPVEDAALKQALGKLDANWTDMDAKSRAKVINEAAHYLGPPVVAKVLPKLDQTLAFAQKDIVPATKKNAVLTYDLKISPDLNATDERIANYVRVSQGHFITNKYGERMDAFAGQARGIVASGLEKGLGSAAIAEELYGELSMHSARGLPYWNTIAMVYANRARTMTQLASYHEAGIEAYVWESVLDEATSVQCRFLHGKRFPVAHAMHRFQQVEDADSPEAIKTLQPFVSLGRDGDRDALVFGSGEDRQVVAHVAEDARGKLDEAGSFENPMNDDALQAAGITAPPIHGNCRSTIIPEFGSGGGGGKPVPAAPPPAPVKPTSGQKKAAALEALEQNTLYGKAQFGEGTGIYYESQPPFLNEPIFNQPSEDLAAQWAANAESKKPKIADLTASKSDCDAALVEKYIKNAKALDDAPKPKVVLHNDGYYILSGHEQILAQKLLGQKQAYVDLVNLDHPLVAAPAKEVIAPVAPAVVHDALTDPHATVVWGKTALHEGKALNGIPLAPAEKGYWETVKDKKLEEPALPGGKVSAGCVVVEPDGRIWLFEPKDHFGGYEHTFPKGTLESGLSTQQNALKELYEEAGLSANIVEHLGDYKGDTGTTRYYIAHRTGGAPWDAHWESDKVKLVPIADAGTLLNKDRDKKILADLVKTLGQPKAPLPPISPTSAIAPAFAPAAPSPSAAVVLGSKVGEQAGTNPGGMYLGTDGVRRYVKFYADPLQAHTEQLANSIYRDLGHASPKSVTFMHNGKLAYASEILKNAVKLEHLSLTPELAQKAMKGFVGDVLTSNWDAVGYSLDNMMLTPGGDVARIDNGGCFLLRAQGARKPLSGLNILGEWEGFFSSSQNASYFKIAHAAGYGKASDMRAVILPEIEKVMALRDAHGGWAGYVEKTVGGMAPADKARVVEMLEARTTELQKKVTELKLMPSQAKKVFPKGAPISARPGARIKAPKPDPDLLEVRVRKDLPVRDVDIKFEVPPGGEDVHAYIAKEMLRKTEREFAADASAAATRSMKDFTMSGSKRIRAAQSMTKEKYIKEYSASSYEDSVRAGKEIETIFGKVASQPGQVFRGIGSNPLSDETMDKLMHDDEIGMLGTASCSRKTRIAKSFMGGLTGDHNRCLFVIHQHSAVAIEGHSECSDEGELLLSNLARFRVLSRHRATENSNCLVIECEEIEGLVPVKGSSIVPKKPRKPRKPRAMPGGETGGGGGVPWWNKRLVEVQKDRGELDFDVHSTMPWLLPEGWPTHGELDGKRVDLVEAARTMSLDRLACIFVEIPDAGRIRPWRGQDIAFDSNGVLLL